MRSASPGLLEDAPKAPVTGGSCVSHPLPMLPCKTAHHREVLLSFLGLGRQCGQGSSLQSGHPFLCTPPPSDSPLPQRSLHLPEALAQPKPHLREGSLGPGQGALTLGCTSPLPRVSDSVSPGWGGWGLRRRISNVLPGATPGTYFENHWPGA